MEETNVLRTRRLEKLIRLEELGIHAYAYKYERTHLTKEVTDEFQSNENKPLTVSICGRLMAIRKMGKASFCHLMDRAGRIQIYVKSDEVGEETYTVFKLLDIGDIIGVRGDVFRTNRGEITIVVRQLILLSKNLRPLPIVKEKIEDEEKIVYDQFADKEMRYRQRYVDLIVNPEVRETFILRSKIVSAMRTYLENKGYLEMETPVLQPQYGGAYARPFVTHHNTLDMDLYLRIADELYLKRLIIGGYDGVFEISKDFRNEGMDKDHNPEFTMMELYVAYEDYYFLMDLTEDMMRTICRQVIKSETVQFEKYHLDFGPKWKRLSFFEAIKEATDIDLYQQNENEIAHAAKKCNLNIEGIKGKGKLLDAIFSTLVEPKLIQPTFIIDYPIELSPLAKKHRSIPGVVERFEGYVAGKEICNAFSELNDPVDQKNRLEEQAQLRAQGDDEAMVVDHDFIRAMEYGMPPTTGIGIGIDRLTMILANAPSIRDVILFPQMRSEFESKE